MGVELAVLVIHGMGTQRDGFADDMIEELNDRLMDLGKDPDTVVFKPIYWANILDNQQRDYLRRAKVSNDLDYIDLRRFMTSVLGDVSAYRRVPGNQNNSYDKIHARIARETKTLYEQELDSNSVPLVVMAHSLGGHIMSNYIWDVQQAPPAGLSNFEKMETLSGIITFGCNIPLFTFAYDQVEPIKFPPSTLPQHLKDKAKWLNYYDPDDVLAYPLKPINPAYNDTVSRDIAINVGGIFSSWNPLSHTKYWTDNDFTKPAAQYLSSFL